MFTPSSDFFCWPRQGVASLVGLFLVYMFHVLCCLDCSLKPCGRLLVLGSLVLCVLVTFPYGVPCQVWCLVVSISDLCLSLCFVATRLAVSGPTTAINSHKLIINRGGVCVGGGGGGGGMLSHPVRLGVHCIMM